MGDDHPPNSLFSFGALFGLAYIIIYYGDPGQ